MAQGQMKKVSRRCRWGFHVYSPWGDPYDKYGYGGASHQGATCYRCGKHKVRYTG